MKQALKHAILSYIDEHKNEYLNLGRDFYRHPELAFREVYTAGRLMQTLGALQPDLLEQTAHTGVVAEFHCASPGRTVGVVAEIDALALPAHPDADPETGAAHVCGHHIQTAALAGVAAALRNTGALAQLNGAIRLCGCPAEEGAVPEALYEQLQREEGFHWSSGKQEMLARGCFDGMDALLSTHALINDDSVTAPALLSAGCNGYNRWIFDLFGKSAHPTMDPSKGINALNAAMLALHALQCVKDSLPLDDYSILIATLSNVDQRSGAIPDHTTLQVTTKSRTPAILAQLDDKVLRAVQGAALSIGCRLEHQKIPGYQSFLADLPLSRIYMSNCQEITGQPVPIRPHGYYSNDLGDVSKRVPTAQIVVGGFSGALHSAQFRIEDEVSAYLLPSKMMACTIVDLLAEGISAL